MSRITAPVPIALGLMILICGLAVAQPTSDARLEELERRVDKLESVIPDLSDIQFVAFLFGAFCALWAQNTGRNPWLWFFLGLFLSVITVIVLLVKNAGEKGKQ